MPDNIGNWLEQLGLGQYVDSFTENDIDFDVLPDLADEDLAKLGVSIGDRKRVLRAIRTLSPQAGAADNVNAQAPSLQNAGRLARRLEAERRQLTLMFCDLVDSTELSAQLDPEDLHEVMRSYQETCTQIVSQYKGTVARYMGDGILAYFGYPQAHEDDAELAVRAGLDLIDAVTRLELRPRLSLKLRIGIATGLVVVGDIVGEGMSEEWAASGETPNLAARLQSIAPPNAIIISETSYRVLGHLFEYEDLGRRRLKGFPEPVQMWRILRPAQTTSRFDAMRGQWLTPLLGREEELSRLLRRWHEAKGGNGQVVLISGEPGIGKSRTVDSFRDRLAREKLTQLIFQGSPLHNNSTLYPVIARLKIEAGLDQVSGDDAMLDQLERYLHQLPGVGNVAIGLLAELLSIPAADRYPRQELTPQGKKNQTLSAIIDLLGEMAKASPVLMIIEDAQWLDPTSLELLEDLISWTESARAMTILTFRPEFSAPWVGQSHVALIALSRLTQKQTTMMVTALSEETVLSAALTQEIVNRTDGIPLFIEELTKTILESGSLAPEPHGIEIREPPASASIPTTLQDSLMARLDQLSTAKEVAQLGAMIGREFPYELLSRIARISEATLQESLAHLTKSGLVFQHGKPPSATYVFKHALVRDVAYQSLLNSVRAGLHIRIAEALDSSPATESEAPPELIGHHYFKGEAWQDALRCWQRAIELAFARSAHMEALGHIEQALETTQRLDSADRKTLELELVTQQGAALRSISGYAAPEVAKVYLKARELCREVGDVPERFGAEWQQMQYFLVRGDRRIASELSANLLSYAERQQSRGLLLDAHLAKGMTLFHLGDFKAAREHLEKGVGFSRSESDSPHLLTHGQVPGVFCLSYLGYALWFLGYLDQAIERIRQSLEIAVKREHPFSHVSALTFAARVYQCGRDLEMVESVSNEVISLSRQRGFAYYEAQGLIHLGWSMVAMEKNENGLTKMLSGCDALEKTGTVLGLSGARAQLVDALLRLERYDEALSVLNMVQNEKAVTGTHCWDSELERLRGDLLAKRSEDGLCEAEIWYRKALETARRQHARSLELRAAVSLSKALRAQGRFHEISNTLSVTIDKFPRELATPEIVEARGIVNESRDGSALKMPSARLRR